MYLKALLYIYFVNVVVGRDFVIGMFKHNDILVTQDIVYKEKVPFGETTFKYGKTFACRLTYFRVADRLGFSHGPKVKVIRGGLNKMYIVVKIWTYNLPISVTIQAGCQAPTVTTTGKSKEPDKSANDESHSDTDGNNDDNTTKAEKSDEEEDSKTKHDNDLAESQEKVTGDDADNKGTAGIEGDDGEGKANETEALRNRNHNI